MTFQSMLKVGKEAQSHTFALQVHMRVELPFQKVTYSKITTLLMRVERSAGMTLSLFLTPQTFIWAIQQAGMVTT